MEVINVSDTKAADKIKESINKEKPGMAINTTKVDKKELHRLLKMVNSSFKKTPPKLNSDNGEYELMNSVIAICNFDTCENDLDSIRTFYEALFPSMLKLYGEVESMGKQLAIQRRDMVPLIESLVEHKLWKINNVAGNIELAAKIIKENGSKYEQSTIE